MKRKEYPEKNQNKSYLVECYNTAYSNCGLTPWQYLAYIFSVWSTGDTLDPSNRAHAWLGEGGTPGALMSIKPSVQLWWKQPRNTSVQQLKDFAVVMVVRHADQKTPQQQAKLNVDHSYGNHRACHSSVNP